MAEIILLKPEQAEEARRVIYTTAFHIFHDRPTLEEALDYYSDAWPLPDIADFQRAYNENGGIFLVTVENGHVVGTGALRRLEEGVGEIKRLWLLPEYQGQGLGYQMMQLLMGEARRRGYTLLRLETSPKYQVRAYAFYRRLGFYDIQRYGDEDDDVGMELRL